MRAAHCPPQRSGASDSIRFSIFHPCRFDARLSGTIKIFHTHFTHTQLGVRGSLTRKKTAAYIEYRRLFSLRLSHCPSSLSLRGSRFSSASDHAKVPFSITTFGRPKPDRANVSADAEPGAIVRLAFHPIFREVER